MSEKPTYPPLTEFGVWLSSEDVKDLIRHVIDDNGSDLAKAIGWDLLAQINLLIESARK